MSCAEQKPDHFVDLLERLVAHPSKEHAQTFYGSLAAFRDWGIAPGMQAAVQFAMDSEWNWRDGHLPLQDWYGRRYVRDIAADVPKPEQASTLRRGPPESVWCARPAHQG
jgi:hypothetical protein